jgi:hypothetical protein
MELMQANKQWSSRPDDQRFLSLIELNAYTQAQRDHSAAKIVSSRALTVHPVEGDTEALMLTGPNGAPVNITNWSFGQLAARAGAPAGYMRDLPAPLAADCLNYGLHHARDVAECGVLLTRTVASDTDSAYTMPATARAVTGPNYGRIWNSTITSALVRQFGDGVTGKFRVPSEFGKIGAPITKQSTTLYASDRDMWVFLADEVNRIELPNRRNGKTGSLARGFFVSNSEVGASTFILGQFLFDYMCGNHIIWGVEEFQELRIRHTAGAPDRYIEQARPAIEAMANASSAGMVDMLKSAQAKKVEDVDAFLNARFSKSQSSAIKAAHMADEQRPIESLWDCATAATAYAREIQHVDSRVAIEREAGKILKLAA